MNPLQQKISKKIQTRTDPERPRRPANAPALLVQAAAGSSPHTQTPRSAAADAARSDGVLRFVGRVPRALRAALPHRALRHQVPALRREARAQVLEVQDRSSPVRKEDGEAQQHLFRSHGPWTRCRCKRGFREGTGGATAIEERRTGQEAVAAACSCTRFLSDRLQLGVWWVGQFG